LKKGTKFRHTTHTDRLLGYEQWFQFAQLAGRVNIWESNKQLKVVLLVCFLQDPIWSDPILTSTFLLCTQTYDDPPDPFALRGLRPCPYSGELRPSLTSLPPASATTHPPIAPIYLRAAAAPASLTSVLSHHTRARARSPRNYLWAPEPYAVGYTYAVLLFLAKRVLRVFQIPAPMLRFWRGRTREPGSARALGRSHERTKRAQRRTCWTELIDMLMIYINLWSSLLYY
jgi:hypothetical protein